MRNCMSLGDVLPVLDTDKAVWGQYKNILFLDTCGMGLWMGFWYKNASNYPHCRLSSDIEFQTGSSSCIYARFMNPPPKFARVYHNTCRIFGISA